MADAAVQDEVHGIGGVAGAHDVSPASTSIRSQRRINSVGVLLGAENLGEPVAQAGVFLFEALMLRDHLVLAPFERMIEFGDDADFLGDEVAGAQRLLGRGRQMHQHQLDAAIVRGALDLGEAVGRRGIDAGDELEVEQQEAAFRLPLSSALTYWYSRLAEPKNR